METKKEKKLYLEEDKDLIAELEAVTDLTDSLNIERQKQTLAKLQIKATLRNRRSIKEMDMATGKFSIVLVILALAQIVLGVLAFLFNVTTSSHLIIGFFLLVVFEVLLFYLLSFAFNRIKRDEVK